MRAENTQQVSWFLAMVREWKKKKRKSPYPHPATQTNLILLEILCRRTSFDCAFVVVVFVAGTQFFTVAGPSVGAVKHSGVFSCDWDSLEEENVRHGAWLSACWSSSRGLGENIWRRRPS